MITASSTLDILRQRFGVKPGARVPVVLPKVGRMDLPGLCRDLGFTIGAEIGVWKGAFSAAFCEANPAMHMYCVDPWISYPAWVDTKNALPPVEAERYMAEAYQQALARLDGLNCTILRQFSEDAVQGIPDASLDFLYIDSNHAYESVLQDLTMWSPKVRPGGLCAGHDFRKFSNKPFIHVIEAVTDFTEAQAIEPWFVLAKDRTPSFLWVQP